MTESQVSEFWQSSPCGETLVGGVRGDDDQALDDFFARYDDYRYSELPQILTKLDAVQLRGKRVLEIGLGEGADSEQLIRRGAVWSGLDLTEESVRRVRKRLDFRELPYEDLKCGSALAIPFPSNSFDFVFSHGVLHHIPQIACAQREIARVLKPEGELIAMLYAKWSVNYLVSIGILRRLALMLAYPFGIDGKGKFAGHMQNARRIGLWRYLRLRNFIHANTDGPLNPYAKVYDLQEVRKVFKHFRVSKSYKTFMHAPPLPSRIMHSLPGETLLGWNLWVHLRPCESVFE